MIPCRQPGSHCLSSSNLLLVLGAIALAGAITVFTGAPVHAQAQPTINQPFAMLQALDKITARVRRLDIAVGSQATFGTLEIIVQACRSTRPEQTPEDAGFLQIYDTPPGQDRQRVFSGWMFASSPALSAMDHAVYDIWVLDCGTPPPPPPENFDRQRFYSLPRSPILPPRPPE